MARRLGIRAIASLWAALACLISLAAPAFAEDPVYVHASLIANVSKVIPGQPFKLGVRLKMDPGWHTYYKVSGDAGLPTKIEWRLPAGFKAGELEWRKPNKFTEGDITTYGYHDETVIAATIMPAKSFPVGKNLDFSATVKWLSCKEICVPGKAEISLSLPAGKPDEKPLAINDQDFQNVNFIGDVTNISFAGAQVGGSGFNGSILDTKLKVEGGDGAQLSIWAIFGLALVGGLILNAMPCVLPVIAIKVLSLISQAEEDRKKVRLLGVSFAAGVISSFLSLALIVILIKSAGQSVGWGFQFQYPGFVVFMCAVVLLFALSLFGLFHVHAGQGEALHKLASKEGYVGTFFKGVLATVLSTPCTAPFLGTALGFAFAQPGWLVAGIFATVGLGMSSPYLILTLKPDLVSKMPKPGVWMEKLKESMGFILLVTVAWLLSVLGKQVGVEGMVNTCYFLVVISFAAWMIGRYADLCASRARCRVVWGLASVLSLSAFYFLVWMPVLSQPVAAGDPSGGAGQTPIKTGDGIQWQPFSIATLDSELGQGKTVFIDFTAEWCLTCHANETAVFGSKDIVDKFKALDIVPLKADWTKQDPTITKLLAKFGRSGVPLYVIFPKGRPTEPIVLPEVINKELVLEKLDQATKIATR